MSVSRLAPQRLGRKDAFEGQIYLVNRVSGMGGPGGKPLTLANFAIDQESPNEFSIWVADGAVRQANAD